MNKEAIIRAFSKDSLLKNFPKKIEQTIFSSNPPSSGQRSKKSLRASKGAQNSLKMVQ